MIVSKPVMKRLANGIKFEYTEGKEKGTVIRVKDFRRDRYDNKVGTVSIKTEDNDLFTPIRGIDLTLNSLRSRSSVVNDLVKRDQGERDSPFWDSIINDICNRTLNIYRTRIEIEEIRPDSETIQLEYLVYPVLPDSKLGFTIKKDASTTGGGMTGVGVGVGVGLGI